MPEQVGKDVLWSNAQKHVDAYDDRYNEEQKAKELAKLRRKKYLDYLMQVQEAIGKQDLQRIRDVEENVMADHDLDLNYRLFLQESIKQRVMGETIGRLREKKDIVGLVKFKNLIEKKYPVAEDKSKYSQRIDNVIDHVLSNMDSKEIRAYQTSIFFTSSVDNAMQKILFDLIEPHAKKIEEAERVKKDQKRRATEYYGAQTQLTDLPLVDGLGNFLEQGPTFPLDVEGVVAKFKLYDFDKLQKFRERIEQGDYPLYREQLIRIIKAFEHEFSEQHKEEKEIISARGKWHRRFQQTVRKYRTERRKPGTNVGEVNKRAYSEMTVMSSEIAIDSLLSLDDKAQLFGKIRDYLKMYPTAQSLVMSLMQARFPKKS